MSDYNRVEKAMAFMVTHAHGQPSLNEVAAHIHLSPFHFQRLFTRFAGTTPKRFLQAITLERGKRLLTAAHSLADVSADIGLSGTSRLHDHFVQLEAVTPGEYKSRGAGLMINYAVHPTPFGEVFVAVTPRGVCRMGFIDYTSFDELLARLRQDWPMSVLENSQEATRHVVDALFAGAPKGQGDRPLSLHVAGTNFQVAVWRALLNIPAGKLASYSQVADALGCTNSSRAVGNAVGANPVALLIPCHRVIQKSGALGGYRWGLEKKQMVQAWEQANDC